MARRRSSSIDMTGLAAYQREIVKKVKVHEDPERAVTYVYSRDGRLLFNLDENDSTVREQGVALTIARELEGKICPQCGELPEKGRIICCGCVGRAVAELGPILEHLADE
jgi:NADH pyrophosphatase NudC (nudix superfamily)